LANSPSANPASAAETLATSKVRALFREPSGGNAAAPLLAADQFGIAAFSRNKYLNRSFSV